MSGLNYAFSNQNRQRKCSVFVSFRLSLCHSTLCVYTDVEINTCSFQKGCPPPLGLCLLAQSLWRESNVLDNWQLTMLPLSELCEFNPHWARDNLAASLWVIGHFPQPGKKTTTRIFMYACVRACMCSCIYACLHVCLHARVNVRTHASSVVLSNIYGDANNILNTNMLYAKTQFTAKGNI